MSKTGVNLTYQGQSGELIQKVFLMDEDSIDKQIPKIIEFAKREDLKELAEQLQIVNWHESPCETERIDLQKVYGLESADPCKWSEIYGPINNNPIKISLDAPYAYGLTSGIDFLDAVEIEYVFKIDLTKNTLTFVGLDEVLKVYDLNNLPKSAARELIKVLYDAIYQQLLKEADFDHFGSLWNMSVEVPYSTIKSMPKEIVKRFRKDGFKSIKSFRENTIQWNLSLPAIEMTELLKARGQDIRYFNFLKAWHRLALSDQVKFNNRCFQKTGKSLIHFWQSDKNLLGQSTWTNAQDGIAMLQQDIYPYLYNKPLDQILFMLSKDVFMKRKDQIVALVKDEHGRDIFRMAMWDYNVKDTMKKLYQRLDEAGMVDEVIEACPY